MPRVPAYDERQIQTRPLSAGGVSPLAPAEVFGGGEAAPRIDLRGPTKVLADEWKRARDAADRAAVLDADNQAWEVEKSLFWDPKQGAFNARGLGAIDASDKAMGEYEKRLGEIEGKLTSDVQREAFQTRSQQRRVSLDRQLQEHVAGQVRSFEQDTTDAAVRNRVDEAVKNPWETPRLLAEQQQIIGAAGFPPEVAKLKIAQVQSGTVAQVIGRLVASDAPGADREARQFYDAHKQYLTGNDITAVEKAMEESSVRGESQRSADDILGRTGGDYAKALDAAKGIEDPKLRDAVTTRIDAAHQRQNAIEREEDDARYLAATNLVDKNPAAPARLVVPADQWAKLSLPQRNALEARSGDPVNDDKRWLQFLDLSPQEAGNMTQSEFETKYWSRLDKQHRERAAAIWAQSRDAMKTGRFDTEKLTTTLTFKDRIENALRTTKGLGFEKMKSLGTLTGDKATQAAQFEQAVARDIEQYELTQLGGKRKATGEEMQGIIDKALVKRVFVDRNWFSADPQVPISMLTQDELGQTYVPKERIPANDWDRMTNLMRANGVTFSASKVQKAYAGIILSGHTLDDLINTPALHELLVDLLKGQ